MIKQSTQVENVVFDQLLPTLTESELKVLLIIIRQTNGWIDLKTGKRKTRDRITYSQFIQKTGLSRRSVSGSIQSLLHKRLITISDRKGQPLHYPESRKGRSWVFYEFGQRTTTAHIRTNYGMRSIGDILSTFKIARMSD